MAPRVMEHVGGGPGAIARSAAQSGRGSSEGLANRRDQHQDTPTLDKSAQPFQ